MVTLTPSSEVGRAPLTIEWLQSSVLVARPVPWMVTHELATTPAWKLAPFATAVMTGGNGMDTAYKRSETSGTAQLPGTQVGGPSGSTLGLKCAPPSVDTEKLPGSM